MEDEIVWNIQFDAATPLGRYELTDEGYLRVAGTAAAVGTMTYVNAADGSEIVDYVPPETLEAAADGLKHTPITFEHPPGLLDSKTVREYQVGEVVDSVWNANEGRSNVELLIRDHEAVQAVLDRKVTGLSPGYRVRREAVADSKLGYNRVQVERKYNHLAICKKPRRGEVTQVHLDSEGNAIFDGDRMEDEETPTPTANDSQAGNLDAVLGAIATLNAKVDALVASAPAPEAPADEETEGDADDFLPRAQAYARVVAVAKRLGVEYDEATDSTDAIQRKVVEAKVGNVPENASAEYIAGAMSLIDLTPESDSEDEVADAFGFNRPAKKREEKDVEVFDPTRAEMNRKAYTPTAR